MVTGKTHKPTRFTRLVLYPLTGVLFLVLLSAVLVLATGYRFTFKENKIGLVKTGMLIVTTRPFDAQISINGKLLSRRTGFYLLPTKISSLAPGFYDVQLIKKDYRTWRDNVEIKPNMVTWANYVLLFKEKLNISKVEVPKGSVITASDNGRHALFASTTETFNLSSLDTGNQSIKNFWPDASPLEPWLVKPQIISATYSPSNDRALMKVANAGRVEYVVVDASSNPAKIIHLNSTLKQDFSNAWWDISNNSEMYLETTSGISRANINDTTLAVPIVTSASSFTVDESSRQLLYVIKNANGTYSVDRANLDGGNKAVLVDTILPASGYKLGYSPSFDIVTVLNVDNEEMNAYYVGSAKKQYSVKLASGVKSYSWSKDGQYIQYYGKDFVKRYDWEKNKEISTLLTSIPTNITWYFDEHHYLVTDNQGVHVMDINGSNVVPISAVPTTFSVLDKGNHNIIFSTKDVASSDIYERYNAEF